jgi:hypothetical protein
MNATQRVVTGFMAVLMLGALLMMPPQGPAKATAAETPATVIAAAAPQSPPELPQDQVRDLTY